MLAVLGEVNTLLETHDVKELKGLMSTVDRHFGGEGETDWGLKRELDGTVSLDETALDRMLLEDPEEVFDRLLGTQEDASQNRPGLLDEVISRLETIETNFGATHGHTGLIVNRTA